MVFGYNFSPAGLQLGNKMYEDNFQNCFLSQKQLCEQRGNTSVMARIYLNSERLSIGSIGIYVKAKLWDKERECLKGRSTEALSTNLQLDNIKNGLLNIFRRLEFSDELSLERIKSEYSR